MGAERRRSEQRQAVERKVCHEPPFALWRALSYARLRRCAAVAKVNPNLTSILSGVFFSVLASYPHGSLSHLQRPHRPPLFAVRFAVDAPHPSTPGCGVPPTGMRSGRLPPPLVACGAGVATLEIPPTVVRRWGSGSRDPFGSGPAVVHKWRPGGEAGAAVITRQPPPRPPAIAPARPTLHQDAQSPRQIQARCPERPLAPSCSA